MDKAIEMKEALKDLDKDDLERVQSWIFEMEGLDLDCLLQPGGYEAIRDELIAREEDENEE